MKVYFSTPGTRLLSFSFNCSIRNVPRKQNTIIYTKIGCQEDPAAFHHPSTAWEVILYGSWKQPQLEDAEWKPFLWHRERDWGWIFGIFIQAPLATPLNLLLVTPGLEQDCCKLKFYPFMAPGIFLHCVNIFNASSCKSLQKPFPPSLIFSILRFPDSSSTSKALSAPLGFARALEYPWKVWNFPSAGNSMQVFLCSDLWHRTNSGLFCSREPWHT